MPQDMGETGKYGYITFPFNILVSVFARLSITILLICLFGIHKWFKTTVISLFCLTAVMSIAFILINFCQITPVTTLWDSSIVVKEAWDPQIWICYTAILQCEWSKQIVQRIPRLETIC